MHVEMWPPNGGLEPTRVQEQKVDQYLGFGWTLAPQKPTPTPRRPVRISSTDKPKASSQGTAKEES